jgi:hypothetical protein
MVDRLGDGSGQVGEMLKRSAMILSVLALAAMLNGCTKCGPIWDDWFPSQKSCKSDHF